MLVFLVILAFTSVASGVAVSAVLTLNLRRSPGSRRALKHTTRLWLGLLLGVVSGIGTAIYLGFMWWVGLYSASTVVIGFISTVIVVATGICGGMALGTKIFESIPT